MFVCCSRGSALFEVSCLGVTQRTPSALVVSVLKILCALLLAPLSASVLVVILVVCRSWIRLCTSVTSGETMIAMLLCTRVGSRQYSDPFLLAGTTVSMLWLVVMVLMTLRRLGWNVLKF